MMNYKEKRCAAHSGFSDRTITIISFMLDFPPLFHTIMGWKEVSPLGWG